jgi:hypothetical protein
LDAGRWAGWVCPSGGQNRLPLTLEPFKRSGLRTTAALFEVFLPRVWGGDSEIVSVRLRA